MLSAALSVRKSHKLVVYLAGQSISDFGDKVYAVTIPFILLAIGGNAKDIGGVYGLAALTQVFGLLFGGVLADQWNKRLLMLAVDAAKIAIYGLLICLFMLEQLTVGFMYVASLSLGLLNAVFSPASRSILPELAGKELIASANSVQTIIKEVNRIIGPALGGLILSAGSIIGALTFNLVTFLASIASLFALNRSVPDAPTKAKPRKWGAVFLRDAQQGWEYVASQYWLRNVIVVSAVVNIALSAALSVALPLKLHAIPNSTQAYGFCIAALGIGTLSGAALFPYFFKLEQKSRLSYLALSGFGAAFLWIGLTESSIIIPLCLFVAGCAVSVFNLTWESMIQTHTEGNMLGRVASLDAIGSYALMPLGLALSGVLISAYGVLVVFLIAGVCGFVGSLIGITRPSTPPAS